MIYRTNKQRLLLGMLVVTAGAVLAACGGGAGSLEERAQPLGLNGSVIVWSPSPLAFTINPGGTQSVPITLTTSASLANVAVRVVPELQNIVSVSPTSFAALTPGQQVTVTVTVAPSASERYRTVDGTLQLRVGSSSVAKPLPVSLTFVAPETINGALVPPEPPPTLRDATLAGFDTNGNGVRDDVEREVAAKSIGVAAFDRAMVVAKTYQNYIVAPTFSQADFDTAVLGIVCFEYRAMTSPVGIDSPEMRQLTFSTAERRKEWGRKAFRLGPRTTNAARECTS